MATTRVAEQLAELRRAFEKAEAEGSTGEERLRDVLQAMSKIVGTVDLLKQSGAVQMLQAAKKKHADADLGEKIKELLAKWKKDCSQAEAQKEAQKEAPKKVEVKPEPPRPTTKLLDKDMKIVKPVPAEKPTPLARVASEDAEFDDGGYLKGLHGTRQRVVKVLADVINISTGNSSISAFIATEIEAATNQLFNAATDERNYSAKARTLSFNLKANQRLRDDVISGAVPATLLVSLSAKELATDDLKEARAETTKAATMARRGDLYEITRSEILASNGIDPNKGGEFVCRKCKGTKTSHYSLQTRSSDEPMTVFVCCLTCGNRWRTQ